MRKYALLVFFICFTAMGMEQETDSEVSAVLRTMDGLLKRADEIIRDADNKNGFCIITHPDQDSLNYATCKAVLNGNTEKWVLAKIWNLTFLMQQHLSTLKNASWTEEDKKQYKDLLSMRNKQYAGVHSCQKVD